MQTRVKILEAALELLREGDLSKVRMTDIARRAGISRQAVYLHYDSRADLLVAATKHLDDLSGVEERLAPSRAAATGRERLDAYVECWGGYIPEIYGLAKAFFAMLETDAEAAEAWNERMQDMREGCGAAVDALKRDGDLRPDLTPTVATDMLFTLLSVRNWELLTQGCGWSTDQYKDRMKSAARRVLMPLDGLER